MHVAVWPLGPLAEMGWGLDDKRPSPHGRLRCEQKASLICIHTRPGGVQHRSTPLHHYPTGRLQNRQRVF